MGMPFQNSPLPPSLGGMPQFSMMNTPPRPMHMNGNRPPMHPGEKMTTDVQIVFCLSLCKHGITWSKSMDVARHMLLALVFHQFSPIISNHQRENYSNHGHHCYFSYYIWSSLHLSRQDWLQCSISVNNLGRNQDLTGYCGSATFSHKSFPTPIISQQSWKHVGFIKSTNFPDIARYWWIVLLWCPACWKTI